MLGLLEAEAAKSWLAVGVRSKPLGVSVFTSSTRYRLQQGRQRNAKKKLFVMSKSAKVITKGEMHLQTNKAGSSLKKSSGFNVPRHKRYVQGDVWFHWFITERVTVSEKLREHGVVRIHF